MSSFCEYLRQKGCITDIELDHAKSQLDILNLKTGLCALAFGFLHDRQIRRIIGIQQRTGRKFGEIAVSLGYLTTPQLETILQIQRKYRVTLEDVLLMNGSLSHERLAEEQQHFEAVGGSR